jgi:hypothetical protein
MSINMPKAKTIVWDIDDVLNNLTKKWFETEWLLVHSDCPLVYPQLTANPPHGLLGVSKEEYLESLDKFRLSPGAAAMVPDKILLDWFLEFGDRYRHIAMTARPRDSVYPAIKWLLDHFGEWFQNFSFVPSERPEQTSRQPDRNKGDYLAWLGKADYFIDDNTENYLAAKELGIRSFLVSQPWNKSDLSLGDILRIIPERSGE